MTAAGDRFWGQAMAAADEREASNADPMSHESPWLDESLILAELEDVEKGDDSAARTAAVALSTRVALHNGFKERLLMKAVADRQDAIARDAVRSSNDVATATQALTSATRALVAVTVLLFVAAVVSAVLGGLSLVHDPKPQVVKVCTQGESVTKC